ncbi:MAG TPA: TonB-dependent receptor [Steroidobacteraceae bacterium]|nr:TonB-dependent receptor [Steroidobacteraceae bacterium]
MNSYPKLSYAIAAILSSGAGSLAYAATPADTGSEDQIQEITVTAQRRSENMQNVPVTIQALTSETLAQLNVQTFDDFIKYLPNVTATYTGPGQSSVFMRGLSTTPQGVQGSGSVGGFPSVAIYLDDQSGALPGRNLDVYAADLERIEVLEGPQGTLFGAGAESGVMRYITNKPKLDVTEGNMSAGYETTAGGGPSDNLEGVINVPLISDTLAVRAVVYSNTQGGYINNIPATFSRQPSDYSIQYYYGGAVPSAPGSLNSINNNALVGSGINTVEYKGIRVGLAYKINDQWDALLTQSYQDMKSNGVFYEMPHSSSVVPSLQQPLPDLSVESFVPSWNHDAFENTALTVTGRAGDLKLVYTGGYLVRKVEQQQDYTGYSRGANAAYYQCMPYGVPAAQASCGTPAVYWRDTVKNTHDSQEFRVSTPDDWRLRGIAGVFWEDYSIHDNTDWFYKAVPSCSGIVTANCLTNVGPPPGSGANNPAVRPDNESYFDDITRGYSQKALFGSVDYDIIPKKLTVTVGTRYYKIDTTETGYSASSFYCNPSEIPGLTLTPPCLGAADTPEYKGDYNKTYSGFRSRANLSWHVTEDALLYYTWSQGFRAGGFNRGESSHTVPGTTQVFTIPTNFAPDTLVNNEIGWKTQWDDHRYEFNGAVYREDWRNIQVELFLPLDFSNLSFVVNGPSYRVQGLELQFIARPVHGLTLTGGASWNSSNQLGVVYLNDTLGQPITSVRAFGDPGVPLAQSPPQQFNMRIRYEWDVSTYKAFAQVGGVHNAHSLSSIASTTTAFPDQPGYSYNQPDWTEYDASAGFGKDAWMVHFYGSNLGNNRSDLYENPNQFIDAKTISRPRTLGVRISYKF